MPRTRPFHELKTATRQREGADERIEAAQQRALEDRPGHAAPATRAVAGRAGRPAEHQPAGGVRRRARR